MAVITAYLRRRWIHVFPYLDNWLLWGTSETQVAQHVGIVRDLFTHLGLVINIEKSSLVPTQRLDFIEAILDSNLARACLPQPRFQAMATIIHGLQNFPTTSVRTCLGLLGHMAACTFVTRHARLRLCPLQTWLNLVYRLSRDSIDTIVTIPPSTLGSLNWWLTPSLVYAGLPFHPPQPSVSLMTDASSLGWGAHLGSLRTQGLWSPQELTLHINV